MSDLYPTGPSMSLGNAHEEHSDRILRGVNRGYEVGLAELPNGCCFRCTDCMYIDNGVCKNHDSRIYNRPVTAAMCCNYFNHDGMKVIV